MSFCFDDEAFEPVLLDGPIALVFPQPFDVRGRQELQHQPRPFGIWLSIDDDLIGRDVEVIGIVLAEEVGLLQPGLKLAGRVVDRHEVCNKYGIYDGWLTKSIIF